MEKTPIQSMTTTGKIIRRSIHTFLQHYEYFTSIAAFIALPFSISILISQAIVPRTFSLIPTIYGHLFSLFHAAGFPLSSDFLSLLSLKLSQTLSSSIVTLPFALSFLLLSKASIIHFLQTYGILQEVPRKHTSCIIRKYAYMSLYSPLITTHLWYYFIIFSINATCFSLLFLGFNLFPKWILLLSTIAAVLYFIVIANALVICNLALISSGIEGKGGFIAISRAFMTIKGKISTAFIMAIPINLGLVATEGLFHYRIIASSSTSELWIMVIEAVLIAYLYSIILVIDVIMSCLFYQSCKSDHASIMEIEECYYDNVDKLKEFV